MFWALIIENVVRFFNTVLEALAVNIWVNSIKFCLYLKKTRCYSGVQQAHPMKSTGNFDFSLEKTRIFPAKQESQEKTWNLTEQLTEVSILIRIVWDSIRGAFNKLRSAVMWLRFEFRRYWISSKTVCKRLESFGFGSKECGNTFIRLN